MTTSVEFEALCTSPKGETTIFHSDMRNKSNVIIPKKIKWNEVEFPETWHFANAVLAIEQKYERIEQIVQYPDGGGDLIFSNSFRHSSSPRISDYEPSRALSSSIPDESLDMSPTYSQTINTASLDDEGFEINKDLLRKDFYSEVNKKGEFGSLVRSLRTLEPSTKKNSIHYLGKCVNNTSTKTKIWKTRDDTVIESLHPPEAKIEKNINGTIVKASPFKTKLEDKGITSAVDVRRIMEQNNYTNMFLKTIAQIIVARFTCQLKGWWDNYLTFEDRNGILKAYRINEENEVVKDEEGQDIEDAVATLIYSISKHFIGDPAKIKDKTANLLTNLKCPKLHDFRWYREIFLTKVMLRSDCNKSFWKEKFISGLPRLLSERIRIKIREQFNGQIPYDKLTYREIISIVTSEGIKLIYKNEFGSFCSQFGFNQKETKPPSKQSKKQVSRKPSKEKFYHSKRDDINQLDSSGEEISSQTSSDQEECIKDNCDCQPKTINVIIQDQELVLDVLRKVKDEKTKQDLYEVFEKSVGKQEIKKTVNPYNLNEILTRFNQQSTKDVTIKDLQEEVRQYKKEIKDLRQFTSLGLTDLQEQINRIVVGNLVDNRENLEEVPESSQANDEEADGYLNTVRATLNCLQEGLVPIKFCEKTKETLFGANGKKLAIKYKLPDTHICNQGICIKQTFILVKDLKEKALLGVLFLSSIYLMQEINLVRIEDQLKVKKTQDAIEKFKDKLVGEVCSNIPNAFWHRKQHEVELPYEPDFSEKNIPTKARPIKMNKELLSYCDKEIQDLLDKKLIRKSKSPWSCSAFYVQKQAELKRRTPRLVINYKPLNDALKFQNIMDENFNQFSIFIIVFIVKSRVKTLPCLSLVNPEAFEIVETDALDIGYGGILKQSVGNLELLVRYTSGPCNTT
ncbi:hypothetical protein AAG906_041147 [Vitis piasezkii]